MSENKLEITEEQKNIIYNADGRVKVVAIPGSGKSTVIKERILYILNEKKATMNDILILTFTNQAVWQMKERLYDAVKNIDSNDYNINKLPVYTFHSLCNSIIGNMKEFSNMQYTIVNEYGQMRILGEINDEYQLYERFDRNMKTGIIKMIGNIKSETSYDIEDYAKYLMSSDYDNELGEKIVNEKNLNKQFLYIYIKKQKEHKALEFEDLMNVVLYKLKTDSVFRKRQQSRYKYIFCDEFQDVNDKQNMLVDYLSAGYNNLMVVGDDDQNIYSWRGANFRYIKEFNGRKMPLSENFRCSSEVLDTARSLIEHNVDRETKDMRAHYGMTGHKPEYVSFMTEEDEARWIADTIRKWEGGLKGEPDNKESDKKKCGILVRRRKQMVMIKKALDEKHMKYYEDNNDYISMRNEYKIFYCYLKMVLYYNKSDDDFVTTVNYPNRGFTERSLVKLQEYRNPEESLIEALTRKLSEPEERIKPKNIKQIEYCNRILRLHKGVINGKYDCMDVIDELYNMIFGDDKHEKKDDISFVITKRLKKRISDRTTPLKEIVDNYDYYLTNNSISHVYLTTVHGSKGLEFDMVFIPGMTDGCFPPYSSRTEEQYEEERRLLYVAITRAKKILYISGYREDEQESCKRPSPLLGDIEPELLTQEYKYE